MAFPQCVLAVALRETVQYRDWLRRLRPAKDIICFLSGPVIIHEEARSLGFEFIRTEGNLGALAGVLFRAITIEAI